MNPIFLPPPPPFSFIPFPPPSPSSVPPPPLYCPPLPHFFPTTNTESNLDLSFEAELLAVREALQLAWDKGLKRVIVESDSEIVESDSESVVNRTRNQLIRQPKNQFEAIIVECQSYDSREWNYYL
ncbi:hypothetical protein OIU74_015703 [Salix koriyanagi]|uniref:RNase H type-1 domain-containing protein n=1 Tax=Salix koriyanagi TaxID=2511006 RepID=A0A9Q0SVJ1_9ROSI|nr:hypothetical protein OIU74_015703 [Salix koriyanagi]